MVAKQVSYYKTKKYLREDEYFRKKDEILLQKLLEKLMKAKQELSLKKIA